VKLLLVLLWLSIAMPPAQPGDLTPGYWERTPLPEIGLATYYASGTMEWVWEYRRQNGQVPECPECVGAVALLRAGDLGRKVWLQPPGGELAGPFLVVDCAATGDIPALLARNWSVDVGYDLAQLWGMTRPLDDVIVWPDPAEADEAAASGQQARPALPYIDPADVVISVPTATPGPAGIPAPARVATPGPQTWPTRLPAPLPAAAGLEPSITAPIPATLDPVLAPAGPEADVTTAPTTPKVPPAPAAGEAPRPPISPGGGPQEAPVSLGRAGSGLLQLAGSISGGAASTPTPAYARTPVSGATVRPILPAPGTPGPAATPTSSALERLRQALRKMLGTRPAPR
jgi:hypothetical protein